jgi:RNA polymerase sigma-70 factor, ECF subfamily
VDEDLVERAKNGDLSAFEELVERYRQKAYHIAFDFTRDREEAKDLSQEAFLRAYTKLARFDGRSGFYTWFYRILVNMCLDYRRWKKRTAAESYEEKVEVYGEASHSPAPSLDEHVMAREMSERVGKALDSLPPKQRTVFILKNHRGLSIKEIAELMQAAEGTVKVHLHRAVTALRRSLADFL